MMIDDGELIRYLDGELDAERLRAVDAAVRADPEAAARLETLRRRSATLSTLLDGVNPEEAEVLASAADIRPRLARAPARAPLFFRGPPALRIAAALAVLLGIVVAVPPARAWVVEGARVVGEALGIVAPEQVPEPTVAPPDEGAAAAVHFPAAGDSFEVQVPAAGGVLIVRSADGDEGSAEGARFLVLPGALRIEAPAGGVYRVALPREVRTVRVRVGDAPATSHPVPPRGQELRIDLTSP